MGVCREKSQNSPTPNSGKFSIELWRVTTVLFQIEACLNDRPLGVIPHYDEEGMEVLTPGHFLIGRPIEAIPDHDHSCRPISTLHRWHLCEALVRHLWKRWQSEYLTSIQRYSKWHKPVKTFELGDLVVLKEDNTINAYAMADCTSRRNSSCNMERSFFLRRNFFPYYGHNRVKTAFYDLCGQRPPGLYDRNSMHGWFCTRKSLWWATTCRTCPVTTQHRHHAFTSGSVEKY